MNRTFKVQPILASAIVDLSDSDLEEFCQEFQRVFADHFGLPADSITYSTENKRDYDSVYFIFSDTKLKKIEVRIGEPFVGKDKGLYDYNGAPSNQQFFKKLSSRQGVFSGEWIVELPVSKFPGVDAIINELDRKSSFHKYLELESTNTSKWPSSQKWRNVDLYEDDTMWSSYLAGPEDKVNSELQIYPEPSVQGGIGDMFIFDESGQDHDPIEIDFGEWCMIEAEMAASSKSATQYEERYREFVINLMSNHWD